LDTGRQRSYQPRWKSRSGAETIYHIWRASSDEEETIQIDQTGLVGVIGILANDSGGASDVDTDIVWTLDNEMIISTLFGIVMTVIGANETAVAGYKIITMAGNIQEKKDQKQLKASIHEESQQILKDIIREAGK
jgi:hypothetical protein